MDDTISPAGWPDSMLCPFGEMLTVDEISAVLCIESRTVRSLLVHANPAIRLPGVKIGTTWRIARQELRTYLVEHHNAVAAFPSRPALRARHD